VKTIANSQIFRTVLEQWQHSFIQDYPEGPQLTVKIKTDFSGERYFSQLAGRVLTLEGNGGSLLQGMAMLDTALKSRHIADYLGEREAQFPCRWLHLYPDSVYSSEEALCLRLLQLGYNGVIMDTVPSDLQVFKGLGIKVIVKVNSPDSCPFDEEWDPGLSALKGVDGVYWEGTYARPEYNKHRQARDCLQIDLAIRELQELENRLEDTCELIYGIDPQGAVDWIPELMDEAGSKTMLAFSSLDGSPSLDHLNYSHLWEVLRELPDTSATKLLPILNMGGVGQGEGFWPVIPIGPLDYAISHMRRQPFAGGIVLTRHLSRQGTFLDASLWVAAQSLWGGFSIPLLLETWCKAYYPELFSLDLLTDFWKVSRRLSGLKVPGSFSTEECRVQSESLLGELNRLQGVVKSLNHSHSSLLQDYFTFFSRDARRLILHFLQNNHAPMVNVLNGDDLQESFWTVIQQGRGSSLGSGAKVTLLEQPCRGEEGSSLRKIFDEVKL
jgi:hypothetical protein